MDFGHFRGNNFSIIFAVFINNALAWACRRPLSGTPSATVQPHAGSARQGLAWIGLAQWLA